MHIVGALPAAAAAAAHLPPPPFPAFFCTYRLASPPPTTYDFDQLLLLLLELLLLTTRSPTQSHTHHALKRVTYHSIPPSHHKVNLPPSLLQASAVVANLPQLLTHGVNECCPCCCLCCCHAAIRSSSRLSIHPPSSYLSCEGYRRGGNPHRLATHNSSQLHAIGLVQNRSALNTDQPSQQITSDNRSSLLSDSDRPQPPSPATTVDFDPP